MYCTFNVGIHAVSLLESASRLKDMSSCWLADLNPIACQCTGMGFCCCFISIGEWWYSLTVCGVLCRRWESAARVVKLLEGESEVLPRYTFHRRLWGLWTSLQAFFKGADRQAGRSSSIPRDTQPSQHPWERGSLKAMWKNRGRQGVSLVWLLPNLFPIAYLHHLILRIWFIVYWWAAAVSLCLLTN